MINPRRGYTSEQINELLRELARRLEEDRVSANIYLVGGAAMALEYSSRRTTQDIDAVFMPEQTVLHAARAMANELGLNPSWLNGAARAWMPDGEDQNSSAVPIAENLTVRVASPQRLLAMKLAAGRDQDIVDIAVLCRVLRIETAAEAVKVAIDLYGEDSMQLSRQDDLLLIAQEALDTDLP